LASMRAQAQSSRRLMLATMPVPPGTGNSLGQRSVKPFWASTTSKALRPRVKGGSMATGTSEKKTWERCGPAPYNDPRRLLKQGGLVMAFSMHKVQVWSAEVPDRPGAAAAKLELLARAGADLEFIFTRPHPQKPDTTVIFLAPIRGPDQTKAARDAGLGPALDIAMLCVEGQNRAGLGYDIMSHLAVAGINLRGLS